MSLDGSGFGALLVVEPVDVVDVELVVDDPLVVVVVVVVPLTGPTCEVVLAGDVVDVVVVPLTGPTCDVVLAVDVVELELLVEPVCDV